MDRKEVVVVPTEMPTTNERSVSQPLSTPSGPNDELREWARKHVERVHRLKRDVAAYLLGMAVLTAIWALVEWQDKGGFGRLSDGGEQGDWNPWILYVALIWGLVVGIEALKTYFDRPTTEVEVDRVVERLSSRR